MKKAILAFGILVSAAGAANAQAYVNGSIGVAQASVDCSGTTNCDKSSTGFKLIGGYQFHPNLAAEISYLDFGSLKASVPDPVFGTLNGTVKTSGFGIGVAASVDFNSALFGVARLGLVSLKTKVDVTTGSLSGSDSQTKTNPYMGVGAGYRLNPQLSLQAAADFSRAEYAGEKSSIRLFTVGATYRF